MQRNHWMDTPRGRFVFDVASAIIMAVETVGAIWLFITLSQG